MMKRSIVFMVSVFLTLTGAHGQSYSDYQKEKDSILIYEGGSFYQVKKYRERPRSKSPDNVILMIGDGMGTTHVFAGLTANGGHLFLENFKAMGYARTQSANNYITDSAAGGTALSTGSKTVNGVIGMVVDAQGDTVPVKTILELSEEKGLATGLVATAAITHATPASFIAHQKSRNSYEAIADDILKTDIDVFIGGGSKNFVQREDGRDLTVDLVENGYQVLYDMDQISAVKSGKLAGFTAFGQNKPIPDRVMDLPISTETAVNILSQNKKGFFLMVEGSQIDWAAHKNNTAYVVREMLDFDQAIGRALEFAAQDGKTLILVTADHETGGFSVQEGNFETGYVKGSFSSGGHTGVMVPVFAFGPGSEKFTGIMENTDIARLIVELLEL